MYVAPDTSPVPTPPVFPTRARTTSSRLLEAEPPLTLTLALVP